MAILADYLEEQGDPRCAFLRDYLSLWDQAEVLPVQASSSRKKLDLAALGGHERRLRWFACLCVRLTPHAEGQRAWELLRVERARQTVVVAELYSAELATVGQLQAARMTDVESRGRWETLAARHTAWVARTPEVAVQSALFAAECIVQAILASTPRATRSADRRGLTGWQQQLARLCQAA